RAGTDYLPGVLRSPIRRETMPGVRLARCEETPAGGGRRRRSRRSRAGPEYPRSADRSVSLLSSARLYRSRARLQARLDRPQVPREIRGLAPDALRRAHGARRSHASLGPLAADCLHQVAGRFMIANTIDRARGRWREILPQLGIETNFLRNKHGPCPICGGKDRFRFDDREGSGSYYCNQCGPGPGLLLIRMLRGWDHKTACAE